jgi:hypothetical protein
MDCGPGTIMDADPQAHRLRCPRCGTETWLPALPLFVLTGVMLHVAALGWDTWRSTWLQLPSAARSPC